MRVAALLTLLLLAGCASTAAPAPSPTAPLTAAATPTPTVELLGPVQPTGEPVSLVSELDVPWSVVRLDSGSTLISERDRGVVRELTAAGELRDVAAIPGVVASGEGGLLGLAVLGERFLYAYFSTETDNRIVRFPLEGEPGSYALGDAQEVLTGIGKARTHNGGRIAFGPDGMLYATVGDVRDAGRAQDPASLNGKILRMTPFGGVPYDNPFGNLVYSMGHRNPQGIAWDDDGQLWAAEFGQNTWDEFNRIEPGGNYGWPAVEGIGNVAGFVDPVLQWPTSEASPSGLTYYRDTFFLACLGGTRLWAITVGADGASAVAYFTGVYGRIRLAIPGPEGTLWFVTNNTDAVGSPGPGDDHLWQVALDVMQEG